MKNCPKCGNPIDDNQRICLNCGHFIEEYEITEETYPTEEITNEEVSGESGSNELSFDATDDAPSFKVFRDSEEEPAYEPIEEPSFEVVKEPVSEIAEEAETVNVEEPAFEQSEDSLPDAAEESAIEPEEKPSFGNIDIPTVEKPSFDYMTELAEFVGVPSSDETEESAVDTVEEPAETIIEESAPAEELSMTERIRKYQIIPDLQPIDDEEEERHKPRRERRKSELEEITFEPEEKPKKNKKERVTKAQKVSNRPKRSYKPLIKLICLLLIIAVIASSAVFVFTNKAIREKISSVFSREPEEQTEMSGNLALKWIKGKKYSSDFDVLKTDKEELKNKIEESLKKNCTSEYNKLSEHYFGDINGIGDYIGYIDNLGVGIIFELTDSDSFIKSIYVVVDTSEDANKGETLISEYTVCILNALGEIDELSYKNIGVYSSSIKTNTFKSVATYARYNNFVLKKYLQDNFTALIIHHGSDAAIKKFSETEVLDLVNCADEQFLKEEPTEPTTEKVETTELEDGEVYVVKTAGDPLRIRKEPSTDSEVLGTFESGTQILVFGTTDGWVKIMYNNEEAWLSDKFVEKVE